MMQPAPNWGIQVSKAPAGAAGGPQIVTRAGQILQTPKTAPGSSGTPPHILGGGLMSPWTLLGSFLGPWLEPPLAARRDRGLGLGAVRPGCCQAPVSRYWELLGATGVTAPRGSLLGAGVAILSHRYRDTGRLIVRHWYCDTEHPTVRHRYRDTEDPL